MSLKLVSLFVTAVTKLLKHLTEARIKGLEALDRLSLQLLSLVFPVNCT